MDRIVLNISEKEIEEFVGILNECLSDLHMELADTDLMDFRIKLKNRQKLIQKIIDSLKKYEMHAES